MSYFAFALVQSTSGSYVKLFSDEGAFAFIMVRGKNPRAVDAGKKRGSRGTFLNLDTKHKALRLVGDVVFSESDSGERTREDRIVKRLYQLADMMPPAIGV